MRTPPLKPNYLPKAPHLLIPSFWQLGFQNMNLGCTNMKYIAETCTEVFLAVFNFPSGSTRLGRQVNIHQLGAEVSAWISKTNYLGTPPTHVVWLGIREREPPLLLQSRHDILFFLPPPIHLFISSAKGLEGKQFPFSNLSNVSKPNYWQLSLECGVLTTTSFQQGLQPPILGQLEMCHSSSYKKHIGVSIVP